MQFEQIRKWILRIDLPKPSIDTGMGSRKNNRSITAGQHMITMIQITV